MSNGTFKAAWTLQDSGTSEVCLDNLHDDFPEGSPTDEQLLDFLKSEIRNDEQISSNLSAPTYSGSDAGFLLAARKYLELPRD